MLLSGSPDAEQQIPALPHELLLATADPLAIPLLVSPAGFPLPGADSLIDVAQ